MQAARMARSKRETTVNCPECRIDLTRRREGLFEDIDVYACARCEGTFYPAGSLDRLDDSAAVDAEKLDYASGGDSRLPCPTCRGVSYREGVVLLSRVALAGLELRRCPRCAGFWLERGQLEALRALALEVSSEQNAALNKHTLEEQRRRRGEARKRGR
jgi:Zn-finger nucleic acid-binding protein